MPFRWNTRLRWRKNRVRGGKAIKMVQYFRKSQFVCCIIKCTIKSKRNMRSNFRANMWPKIVEHEMVREFHCIIQPAASPSYACSPLQYHSQLALCVRTNYDLSKIIGNMTYLRCRMWLATSTISPFTANLFLSFVQKARRSNGGFGMLLKVNITEA